MIVNKLAKIKLDERVSNIFKDTQQTPYKASIEYKEAGLLRPQYEEYAHLNRNRRSYKDMMLTLGKHQRVFCIVDERRWMLFSIKHGIEAEYETIKDLDM